MKKVLLLASLSLLLITSCHSKKAFIQKEITTDTIKEVLHDTIFNIEKDSSFYNALLECQNGKVVIKAVGKTSSGRKLKTPKASIQNNQLRIDCETEAQELFASWKSTYISRHKELSKPIVTNELTWLQKTQIYIGRMLILVLVLYVLLNIFKFKYL